CVHAMLATCFFFQAEDGIRDATVTGVQTCALPISLGILVGDGEEAHRGVAGGHVGAEGPDPAGADDRDADLPGLGHAREDTLLRPRGDRRDHRAVHAVHRLSEDESRAAGGYLSELSAIWSPTRRAISTVRYSCPVAASITDSVRTGGVSGTMSPALRVVSVPRL